MSGQESDHAWRKVRILSVAIDNNPRNYEMLMRRAHIYFQLKLFRLCAMDASLAIALEPCRTEAIVQKSKALISLDEFVEAEQVWMEYLDKTPDHQLAKDNLKHIRFLAVKSIGFEEHHCEVVACRTSNVKDAIEKALSFEIEDSLLEHNQQNTNNSINVAKSNCTTKTAMNLNNSVPNFGRKVTYNKNNMMNANKTSTGCATSTISSGNRLVIRSGDKSIMNNVKRPSTSTSVHVQALDFSKHTLDSSKNLDTNKVPFQSNVPPTVTVAKAASVPTNTCHVPKICNPTDFCHRVQPIPLPRNKNSHNGVKYKSPVKNIHVQTDDGEEGEDGDVMVSTVQPKDIFDELINCAPFHEKLAETINNVYTLESPKNDKHLTNGACETNDEQNISFQEIDKILECNDAPITEDLVKNIMTGIENDPIYEELLQLCQKKFISDMDGLESECSSPTRHSDACVELIEQPMTSSPIHLSLVQDLSRATGGRVVNADTRPVIQVPSISQITKINEIHKDVGNRKQTKKKDNRPKKRKKDNGFCFDHIKPYPDFVKKLMTSVDP